MADVLPFAGTRFNTQEKQIDLSTTLAPPVDAIDAALQKELHEVNPHNVARITAGFDAPGDDEFNNRFLRAAEIYKEWKLQGVLSDEQRKCFYVYEHEFTLPGQKKRHKRRGFFALVKLQDYRSGKIRAHELTFDAPKNDRLNLLKASMINIEPVFALYVDPEHVIDKILEEKAPPKPHVEFTDPRGDTHRVWLMHKKDPILTINQEMKDKRLYLADGHHRYETALAYRDEMRETTGRRDGRQPYDFIMMYLHNFDDEALFTTSTHRVLARDMGADVEIDEVLEDLEEYFDLKEFKLDLNNIDKATEQALKHLEPKKNVVSQFVMVLPGGRSFELRLKKNADLNEMIDEEFMSDLVKSQDVTILHRYIITKGWIGNPEVELFNDDLYYCRDTRQTLEMMAKRKGCVAFLLNPITKERILEISENGELLPQNSTYFYPKIKSGLVIRDLQVGFG